MSSDEVVEDPYLALGVSKDADISAIRSAHRKLVLKYHPDRLKGEAEQARGKDIFQRVQQAYELLSDPTSRSRYDSRVKLAQLKKEAMARDPPPRTPSYPTRGPPPPSSTTPIREYRDGRIYEERVPSGSYFEEGYRYREEEPRTTSRKYDGYERERRPEFGQQPEKEKKSSKGPEKAANDLPFNITQKLRAKAQKTREVVKEKAREKEAYASNAKSRDREQRRERMEKQSSRRPYAEDDYSSDSDTVTYASINNRPRPRTSKSTYDSVPRTKPKPELPRRNTSRREEDEDEEEDKWHSYHGSAREYIERSQRPGLSGRTSSSRSYWEPLDDRQSGRKSGSDSDKRPRSSKGRRPSIDIQNARPPAMSSHNSAPTGVATMKAQLEKDGSRSKQRSNTGGTSSRSSPKEVPSISRSQTMPTSKPRKGDAMPARSSNLKHTETQDSGYGSSGGQTPDLSGTSPPRPTRYQVVEDEDDVSTILVDPEDRHRRTTSPSPPTRDRDRRDRPQRPTVSTTDSRPRSSRGASYQQSPIEVEPRSTPYRQDSGRSAQPRSGSPRDSPPIIRHNSGKLFGETERDSFTVRYPNVKVSPRVSDKDIKYSRHSRRPSTDESDRERDRDYYPYSHHREALRSPPMGLRRGSVN